MVVSVFVPLAWIIIEIVLVSQEELSAIRNFWVYVPSFFARLLRILVCIVDPREHAFFEETDSSIQVPHVELDPGSFF